MRIAKLIFPIVITGTATFLLCSDIAFAIDKWYIGQERNEATLIDLDEGAIKDYTVSDHGNVTESQHDKEKNYVPNEIIVKFKSETASVLEQQLKLKGEAQRSISLAASSKTPSPVASLDALNNKYRVKNFTPIFKNFKSDKKRIERLKTRDNFKTTYNIKSIQFTKKDQHLLKYYADKLPKGAILTPSGIFIWRPTKAQIGTYPVRFYVKDPPGAIDDETITITVTM